MPFDFSRRVGSLRKIKASYQGAFDSNTTVAQEVISLSQLVPAPRKPGGRWNGIVGHKQDSEGDQDAPLLVFITPSLQSAQGMLGVEAIR